MVLHIIERWHEMQYQKIEYKWLELCKRVLSKKDFNKFVVFVNKINEIVDSLTKME